MLRTLFLLTFLASTMAHASSPMFVNLRAPFATFARLAKGLPLDEQIVLWQRQVEEFLPDVYANIFKGFSGKTPGQVRTEAATKWFPFLIEHAEKIDAQFADFEKQAWPMAQRLANNYPEVDFSKVRVIAMLSLMSFNGKVDTISQHEVAMFGMDFLELVNQNPKVMPSVELLNDTPVMVAHEFTHVLHSKVSDIDASDESPFGMLWKEGIAQVHSQMLVPGSNLRMVLMEGNLADHCNAQNVKDWAQKFLKESQANQEGLAARWFMVNGNWKDLGTSRGGYCLGYFAVLEAMRDHSFNALLRMGKEEAYPIIKASLGKLSQVK
jgi:hypothetical protein